MIWGTIIIIVLIIANACIATEMESIAQSKGCEDPRNYFWLSLVFGLPGWIMVAALPNRNIERQLEQLNRILESQQNQAGSAAPSRPSHAPELLPPVLLSADDTPDTSKTISSFLAQAAKCTRIADIQELWKSYPEDPSNTAAAIGSKISDAALIERMYGSNPDKIQRLLNEITEISQKTL